MKHKLQIISALSLLTSAALAQETYNGSMNGTQTNSYRMNSSHMNQANRLNGVAKASDIIGMTVKNNQGEDLGKVNDLAVDVESGRIVQVILASGGFLGIDDTLRGVPPSALHYDAGQKTLQLDISKDKFKAAPKCNSSNWNEATQSNQVDQVYSYYGQEPYANDDANQMAVMNGTANGTLPLHMDGTPNTMGPSAMDRAHNREIAGNIEATNNPNSTYDQNETNNENYNANANGGEGSSSWSRLGNVQKVSKLMDLNVMNQQNEKIGEVANFMVDLQAGRLEAVIISTGGFLGMDNELSAVPPTALQFDAQDNTLKLNVSKETLANSPHFKSDQWPDFNEPRYAGGVYQAYNVGPYFQTNGMNDADNTPRNVGDRDNSTLTTLDQGNSQADINTTAQIRKQINADDNMSTDGKNVKIITQNGHVTLRGPVNSAEEKSRIGQIAKQIAPDGTVDNQLEVNGTVSSDN